MAFVSPTAVLLSLVALVFSGQYWAAEGTRGELPSQACVPLTRLSVRPVFAGDIFRSPHVGYAIEDGFNPAMQEQEYDRRDNEFHEMKLDLIVGDHQCFSSLPNMATFCTFSYFYTPCIKMTVVPLNNGEETSFSLVPPCRSLCEAALEELARYPGECLEEACPNVRNITIPISTLLETYSNCSNYPIRGICVPRRSLAMSCDPIPCDHAARRLIPSHFQTGYPTQNNLVTAPTHLHSFEEANQEFEGLGLDRLVLDATCQTKLLSTLSFLTFAYFPVCTAYPDQNVRLTLPCRGYCVKAREELSRYNSRDELILDCPAVRYMPRSMSLDFVLSLPIFECSRYYVDKLCVPYSRPAPPINCPFNKPCDKCDKCRTSFKDNPGDLRGKTFGTVTANRSRKYEYVCIMNFFDSFSGPCSWSLSMKVRHCYFYKSVDIALPEGYNVNITVELYNRNSACSPCNDIPAVFGYPSFAHRDYLVAGQHVPTYTGALGWGLDHTSRNSLVIEYTGSTNQIKKIKRSLKKIHVHYLPWTH